MSQTLPPFIGYTPSGSNPGPQLIFGGNPTGAWEGIGLGKNGRPDGVSGIYINLTNVHNGTPTTVPGVIHIDSYDLMKLIAMNATSGHVPTQLNFKLTEIAVCEDEGGTTTEKRMIGLFSQTYTKPDGA